MVGLYFIGTNGTLEIPHAQTIATRKHSKRQPKKHCWIERQSIGLLVYWTTVTYTKELGTKLSSIINLRMCSMHICEFETKQS